MKIQYKLGLMAMGLLAFTSCEKHDLIADNMAIGQRVPTVYWTVGSTACKAGDNFSFEGQYYTEDGHQPDHSEVWYSVIREDVVSAQTKLVSSLSFTQQSTVTDTIRTMQHIKSYAHSLAEWDGHQFVIKGECPTSSTLLPVMWQNKSSVWDDAVQAKFDLYFPEGFEETFLADVKKKVMASETIVRDVFCTYGYTPEEIAAVNASRGTNLPTVFDDDEDTKDIKTKKELWYRVTDGAADDVTEAVLVSHYGKDYLESIDDPDQKGGKIKADDKKLSDVEKELLVVKYYYRNDAGVEVNVDKENVLTDELGNTYVMVGETKNFCYPVYIASEWLYCRYDNDAGTIVTTVIDSYTEALEDLVDKITFPEWIKGTAAEGYVATFKRTHKLSTVFKVVDTEGNVGMYTTPYEITLN